MKVYLVSFPDDIPILKRLVKKRKEEILLSYFFLREGKPLRQVVDEISKEPKKEGSQ